MSRHNEGITVRRWSKLKCRVEALFAPRLQLSIHCMVNVLTPVRGWNYDEPHHWVQLGRGKTKRTIWDFPAPFIRPAKSSLGPELQYWEEGCGWGHSMVAELLRLYLDRPRHLLMQPFDDPWHLAAILRAADRRLGRAVLLEWAATLDATHPALLVLAARFGGGAVAAGDQAEAA